MPEKPTSTDEFQESPDSQEIFDYDLFVKKLWGRLFQYCKLKDSLENEKIIFPPNIKEEEKETFVIKSMQNKQLNIAAAKQQIMEHLVLGYIESKGVIRSLPEFDETNEARFLELPFDYQGEELWNEVKKRAGIVDKVVDKVKEVQQDPKRVYISLQDLRSGL